jgi:hypothetical protein
LNVRAILARSAAVLIEAIVLFTMTVLLPISPIASWVFSGNASYLRHYAESFRRSVAMMGGLTRTRVVSRNLTRVFMQMLGARDTPERIEGSCSHCGRCCVDKTCVFLRWSAEGHSQCSIYNNWFWKLTSCGGYPLDGHSIAVYDCPSFKAIPINIDGLKKSS